MAYDQTIKDLYASQLSQALADREAQKRQKQQGYATQETDLTKQYQAQLPQYGQQRDNYSSQAWQMQQALQNRAAAMGNYRAGSMLSDTAANNRTLGTNIANSFKQQNDYTQEYGSNRDKLRAAMAQEDTDYTRDEGMLRQKNAAELASALGQWQQEQERLAEQRRQQEAQLALEQQRIAASYAKASAPKPLAPEQVAANTKDAYDNLNEYVQTYSPSRQMIQDYINKNESAYMSKGVDVNKMLADAMDYYSLDWEKARAQQLYEAGLL